MEDNKKVFKFEGNQGEDFRLWEARTEAALEAKEVLHVVVRDVVEDGSHALDADTKLCVAKARATIIQGLGTKPLRMCMAVRQNPHRMMSRLRERYASVNIATKVQLQSQLARMEYRNQAMSDYIARFEELFNCLSAAGADIEEDTRVAMLLASFGSKGSSPFGHVITSLQSIGDELFWNQVTARLLQEYDEQMWASEQVGSRDKGSVRLRIQGASGAVLFAKNKARNRKGSSRDNEDNRERRRCFKCQRVGHIAKFCRTKNVPPTNDEHNEDAANHATMMMAITKPLSRDDLLLDSGATEHMVNNKGWLHDLRPIAYRCIVMGNGEKVRATHLGKLCVTTDGDRPSTKSITIEGVLLVPDLKANLLSCAALCRTGRSVVFGEKKCHVEADGKSVLTGTRVGGLYRVDGAVTNNFEEHALKVNDELGSLWHRRLGHAYARSISNLARKNAVVGLDATHVKRSGSFCDACATGKHKKLTSHFKQDRAASVGEVIHSDICGKMPVASWGGSHYFMTLLDEYSGYLVVIPVARKSEVAESFRKFHPWFERKYSCSIKRLHCDGGGEYLALEEYLAEQGIERSKLPAHCPELNGMAERVNRTVMESARAMLHHASMPSKFWAEAVVHAADIRNRFLCPRNELKTSYELLTGKKPHVGHIKVSGSKAWTYVPQQKRNKLAQKSTLGVIIGCFENKIYKVWHGIQKGASLSRHLSIQEDEFVDSSWYGSNDDDTTNLDVAKDTLDDDAVSADFDSSKSLKVQDPEGAVESLTYRPPEPSKFGLDGGEQTKFSDDTKAAPESSEKLSGDGHSIDTKQTRYPSRTRRATTFFEPASAFIGNAIEDPEKVLEALNSKDSAMWQEAINSELKSLQNHKTWESTSLPAGAQALPTRFVFTKKLREDGTVARYKARLVVKGYMQGAVDNTYAPVVDFTSLRMALTIGVLRGYHIHQMDVRTAFLHGVIDAEVYVLPPVGSGIALRNGEALQLRKGLYGLKQSPRLWYEKWLSVAKRFGLEQVRGDACVFRLKETWVLLYVDDVAIMGPSLDAIEKLKRKFSSALDMEDMGELSDFLGVTFMRTSKGACLSQVKYVHNTLTRFGMINCKSVSTPACSDVGNSDSRVFEKKGKYQELVSCLLYLSSRTRPDISVAANLLARKSACPTEADMVAAKRVLRYLKGTAHLVLDMSRSASEDLVCYSDSDWAGDKQDRKSTSGTLIQLGGVSNYWKVSKQECVALSSTEAEFIALCQATKAVAWTRTLLTAFGISVVSPTKILEDNQGSICWGNDGVRNAKHVQIRRNFVKDEVNRGTVELQYCPTDKMKADIFTKPLQRVKFERHRGGIEVCDMDRPDSKKGC